MAATYLDKCELLGKGIVLLPNKLNPFEVDNVLQSARRIVVLDEDKKNVGGTSGKGYQVRKGIDYTEDHHTAAHPLMMETGANLSDILDASPSTCSNYTGVSTDGLGKFSYKTALSMSKYYALVTADYRSFTLELNLDGKELKLVNDLAHEARDLGDWKEDENGVPSTEVYDKYKEFFEKWGTCVIRSCSFGARYQLRVESHMADILNKEEFATHVEAEYDGIASVSGSVDSKSSSEFKHYQGVRKQKAKVIGGDSVKNDTLGRSPNDPAKFEAWNKSLNDNNAHEAIHVGVVSVGDIVAEGTDLSEEDRKKAGENLNASLAYFNSFRIVQGVIKVPGNTFKITNFEFGASGPPGIDIRLYPQGSVTSTEVDSTHSKFQCTTKTFTMENNSTAIRSDHMVTLVNVRIIAPPLPVQLKFSAPLLIPVTLDLEGGPTIKAVMNGMTTREAEYTVDSLFKQGRYGDE
ncbi:hypothetical protein BJX99DRAFT_225919 [Aspergillus californicus]